MAKSIYFSMLALCLASCKTVGPEYGGPPASPAKASFVRAGDMQAAPPLAEWWTALNDPTLDRLIQHALLANPNLAVAQARLRHARGALQAEQANLAPSVGATALAARARIPPIKLNGMETGSTDISLYTLGFDASWEADLFGGQRRAVQAATANAESAEASLADAQVSLTAEVAQAYINLRDRQQRLVLSEEAVASQERMIELTQQRYRGGTASKLDVARLQNMLETTRADQMPLRAEADIYRNELAVLVGETPGALDGELQVITAVPLPPAQVNVGDPAAMLQRRPDIRAAERVLAARTAQVGVAEAAKFPSLSLMGLIGLGGTQLSDLAHLGDYTAIVMPRLSWTFLDFGRNKARMETAEADRDEADAEYRAKVLAALQDAENALARFGQQRLLIATLARAKATADEAAALTSERQLAGTASLIDVLDAERQQIAAEQNLSMAKAGLTNDFVGLQKALGLGWAPHS